MTDRNQLSKDILTLVDSNPMNSVDIVQIVEKHTTGLNHNDQGEIRMTIRRLLNELKQNGEIDFNDMDIPNLGISQEGRYVTNSALIRSTYKRQKEIDDKTGKLQPKNISLISQKEHTDSFLRQGYEAAFEYSSSNPLSVNISPFELGKSIGYMSDDTKRIMNELVKEGFVTSSLGMGSMFITLKGLNHLRQLEAKISQNSVSDRINFEGIIPLNTIAISPQVFQIPATPQNNKLVTVMFPFKWQRTFNAIKNACDSLELECKKADDVWVNQTFIQDIFELIFTSKIVIADFTGKNPNVFYEVGIAHTLGKTVIPITQSIEDIPSDLGHHRALKYLDNDQGFDDLTKELRKRLATLVV